MAKKVTPDETENDMAILRIKPNSEKVIENENIDMFESTTIKYKGVTITISDTSDEENSVLQGRTSEEAILLCSDILKQFVEGTSLEEQIDVQEAVRETLQVNYEWTDLEYHAFVRTWRRNLYLKKIGQENGKDLNLKEFKQAIDFIEKQKERESGGGSVGDSSTALVEDMAIADEIAEAGEETPN